MADMPIVVEQTAMLFFDTYNRGLHPKESQAQARIAASGVIPKMVRINQACRDAGIPIFYAQADHRPDNKEFNAQVVDRRPENVPAPANAEGPFRTVSPQVFSGTPEVEIIPEIAPRPEDYVIKKHRWSAFFQTWLELALRARGIDTIMLAGGGISAGVNATAYAARDLGFHLIFLSDVITPSSGPVREVTLKEIYPGFGRVRTVEEAIALFQRR